MATISDTGIIQQTDRPDIKAKLSQMGDSLKAKSFKKDEVLLQVIDKTAVKTRGYKKKISGYYKESEGYTNQEPGIKSNFSVTTRSMQQSMNSNQTSFKGLQMLKGLQLK